jgi:hypothetical protein
MDKDTYKKAMEVMEARGKKKEGNTSKGMSKKTLPYITEMSPEQFDKLVRPNSRAQYLQNKEAGDPLAIENSYEQWKKL